MDAKDASSTTDEDENFKDASSVTPTRSPDLTPPKSPGGTPGDPSESAGKGTLEESWVRKSMPSREPRVVKDESSPRKKRTSEGAEESSGTWFTGKKALEEEGQSVIPVSSPTSRHPKGEASKPRTIDVVPGDSLDPEVGSSLERNLGQRVPEGKPHVKIKGQVDQEYPEIRGKESMGTCPPEVGRTIAREKFLEEGQREPEFEVEVAKELAEREEIPKDQESLRKRAPRTRKEARVGRLEEESPSGRKDFPGPSGTRTAKERRTLLKEQESIERVTEFLAKHSAGSVFGQEVHQMESQLSEKRAEKPREKSEPSTSAELMTRSQEPRATRTSEADQLVPDQGILASTSIDVETNLGPPAEASPEEIFALKVPKDVKKSPKVEPPERRVGEDAERSPGVEEVFSPGKVVKKGVTIQEDVQRIFYEEPLDQVAILPEVHLVTARIVPVEEVSSNLAAIAIESSIRSISPPKIMRNQLLDRLDGRRTPPSESALPEGGYEQLQLQLSGLSKSTSENALASDEAELPDDRKISGRNLKPEVLLDLSKVPDEEVGPAPTLDVDRDALPAAGTRTLARIGSERVRGQPRPPLSRTRDKDLVRCPDPQDDATRVLEPGQLAQEILRESATLEDALDRDAAEEPAATSDRRSPEASSISEISPKVSSTRGLATLRRARSLRGEEKAHPPGEDRICIPSSAEDIDFENLGRLLPEELSQEKVLSVRKTPKDSWASSESHYTSLQRVSKDLDFRQSLTSDVIAEEQHQKALERQREHVRYLQRTRSLEGEVEGPPGPEPGT
ncbi:titin [Orussus abietinus]|uniref:titin n=1 Tax=Orussus abietinus TaxID=222816 RepID=UPI000625A32C|nr:titin [Orussus abietinus]